MRSRLHMTFGAEADQSAAFEQLEALVEAGGTLVDTADVYADVYADGESERIIGRWLANRDNPEVVLATKGRFSPPSGSAGASRRSLGRSQDPEFARRAHELQELAGEFSIRSIIAIDVREVSAIVAPRYRLHPETTVAAQIESAMRTYGVQPRIGSSSTHDGSGSKS